MIILAVETSCDDTCIALLKIENGGIEILSNIVSSQVKLHEKYGGVFPSLAKREHERNLPLVLKRALRKTQGKLLKESDINLIAVTAGPGLEPCLWQGINFAKTLAEKWKKPIIPVNHIEAHMLANWLPPIRSKFQNLFPAISLVVSGGHTQIIFIKNLGKYRILGETRDDAAGECFDKAARILELGYPGGPVIAAYAAMKLKVKSEKLKVNLPRPMISQKNYDFSFSGLKTAVLYDFKERTQKVKKSKDYIQKMCAEIQQAVIDVLIKKTLQATRNLGAKTIILGGGVAANDELRKQFSYKLSIMGYKLNFLVPPKVFCTDNAAMVALTAYYNQKSGKKTWKGIEANANLRIDTKF